MFNYSLVFITRISVHEKILQSLKPKNQEYRFVCITPHQCFEGDGCINAGLFKVCEALRINEPHVAPIFIIPYSYLFPQTLSPAERKLPSIYL